MFKYLKEKNAEKKAMKLSSMGLSLFCERKYSEAIKCYNKALAIDSKDFFSCKGKGDALFSQKKYAKAIVCFDKALAMYPSYASAWYNKGRALYNLKEYHKAIECHDRAISINPQKQQYCDSKNLAITAIQRHNQALQINVQNASTWNNRGVALHGQKKYNEAIQCYDKAISLHSIKTYYDNRKLTIEAIQRHNQTLQIDSKNANIWNSRGVAFHNQRKYNDAIQCFDKAISLNPHKQYYNNKNLAIKALNSLSRSNKGNAFLNQKKGNKVISLNPEKQCYKESKQTTNKFFNAQRNAQQKRQQKNITMNLKKARKHKKSMKYVEAISLYKQYLKERKGNSTIYYELGVCYTKCKNPELLSEGVKYFSKAINLDDKYVAAYLLRGVTNISIAKNNYNKETLLTSAKQDLMQVLSLEPNNKNAKKYLNKLGKQAQSLNLKM